MSTLEDIFINVAKLTKQKNQLIDEEEKKFMKKEKKINLILYNDDNYNAKYSYCSKILLVTKVSIKKRFIQIYRDKKLFS